MLKGRELLRALFAGGFCVAIAACSQSADPAGAEPVDPQAGLYEITQSGAGLLKGAKPDKPKTFCLRESQRADFAHMLVEGYYKLHYSCVTNRAPREGNKVGGEIRCDADPKMAQGTNGFAYEGEVAAASARLEVRMQLDATVKEGALSQSEAAQLKFAMKAMEQARFIISATRTGDCS